MLKAVFFDMDDTVLAPRVFNPWQRFKQTHALPPDLLITEGIATRPPAEQTALHQALQDYELELAQAAPLREGMEALLEALRQRGLALALLTNNSRMATQLSLGQHRLEFDLVLTREDAAPKPSPALLQKALQHFSLEATQAVYIGDSHADGEAGWAVGMPVWYMATPHNPDFSPRFLYPREVLEALLQQV